MTLRSDLVADVALPLPLQQTFAYRIPDSLRAVTQRGSRVAVPFASRSLVGYVVGFDPPDAPATLKPIQRVLDPEPLLDDELLELARWISERTLCSFGEAIRAVIPGHPTPRRERYVRLAHAAPIDLFGASVDGTLEDRIVTFISEAEEIPLSGLAKKLGMRAADLEPTLRGMARAKRLQWTERTEGGGSSEPARIKIVRLIDAGAAEVTRAPVQERCLSLLVEASGVMPLADLVASVAGARAALKRLAEKKIVRVVAEEWEGHAAEPMLAVPEPVLTAAQAAAVTRLEAALDQGEGGTFLLHGVTGSGKTEVYLRAIAAAIRKQKQTIFLVPEITLTPQTVSRLRGRFGGRAAVVHSRLTDAERRHIWHGAKRGDYDVILGPRSAVFAPLPRLGLILIDEEHEAAYKQDDAPRYVARDVAMERGRRSKSVVVLGSATPDLETFERSERGEIERLRLPERVAELPMPAVRLVDIRGTIGNFSRELLEAIADRLEKREQIILFLNRRGFSPFVQCTACGTPLRCASCAVSLTFHKSESKLRCHYCDDEREMPRECPVCRGRHLALRGAGTQRIEEELRAEFPEIRLARLDSDSVRPRGAHEKILGDFLEGTIDVLLGTQMVAKGLDFPRVTLVGVINADHGLHLPDYRSGERTFQLLAQVSGRAGRSALGGEVVVQTRCPEHICFRAACQHDDAAFRVHEREERRLLRYPPFSRLSSILVRGESLSDVERTAEMIRDRIAERIQTLPAWAAVLGPAPAPLAQLRGKFRYRLLLKAERLEDLLEASRAGMETPDRPREVEVMVDIDPTDLL